MGVGMPYKTKTTLVCMFMSIFVCGDIYSKHIFLSYQGKTYPFFIDGHTLLQDVQDVAHTAFCIPQDQEIRVLATFKELSPGLIVSQLTHKDVTLFIDTFPEVTHCQFTQEQKENVVIVYDVSTNEYQNICVAEGIVVSDFIKQLEQELQRTIVHVTVKNQKLTQTLLHDAINQHVTVWVY
jgi:hypothetical protein